MSLLQTSEMAIVNNSSVDTVNAAATAIVTAEARAPPTAVQKRRWSSWWSMYWCFGNHKTRKRIGHAVFAPEPALQGNSPSAAEIQLLSTAIVLPFIAPPSSPASFLQSDPPSVIQSPTGLLSLTNHSFNAYSPRGPGSIFTVGPYAYETQLVSPPVFSTFPTEPSTAPFTPPPELVQLTRPSSPEVPFARLLVSSLEGTQYGEAHQKLGFSYYELQTHHKSYPATPGGQLISPGMRVSYSGTTSPFNSKNPIFDCRIGEAPKLFGFDQSSTWKWGSRIGSGTVTPPDRESYAPVENNKSRVAALPNGRKLDETVIDHRVSFELTGEDVARCLASKLVSSLSRFPPMTVQEDSNKGDNTDVYETGIEKSEDETSDKFQGKVEKEHCYKTQLGSGKEFNFDKPSSVCSEWWTNEKVDDDKEPKSGVSRSFFPILHPDVR